MTDFNKLLAADELLNDIHDHEVKQKSLAFHGMPIEVRDDVPPHHLYLINERNFAMAKGINNNQDWGFFEFVRHSAEYMVGSIHPIVFYLGIPFAWWKFDRQQRRDHGKS